MKDAAARTMTEIVQSRRNKTTPDLMVYHIMNPRPTDWKTLTGVVAKAYDASIVPLDEWVQSLELLIAGEGANLRGLPATSLLDFFRMLSTQQDYPKPALEFGNSQRDCATLRAIGPVDEQLMEVWLRQWKEWIPGLFI
ncbi:unnamed protein product [Penicillium glandicola]